MRIAFFLAEPREDINGHRKHNPKMEDNKKNWVNKSMIQCFQTGIWNNMFDFVIKCRSTLIPSLLQMSLT